MKLLPSVGELVDSGTSHVAATESRAKSSLANSLQKTEAMRGVKVTPSVPGRKGVTNEAVEALRRSSGACDLPALPP